MNAARYIFLLGFLVFTTIYAQSADMAQSARLIESKHISYFSADAIKLHFKKLGIPKMFFPIRYGVNVYDVTYTTTYADGSIVKATGMVFAPVGVQEDTVPLNIYDQGTQLCRERVLNYRGEQAMCLSYAGDGYLVIMPDYAGMDRGEREHLYIHSQTEAESTVDLLKVVADSLHLYGVKAFDKIFISGYSQGGHAALATHKWLQEHYPQRFPVTASAPMSGPYDIEFSVYDGRDKIYDQPGYMPYLLKGYYESINQPERIREVFKSPLDTIIPKYLTGAYPMEELNSHMPAVAFESVRPEYFKEFEENPEHPFRKYLKANNVSDWKPEAPVMLCYCEGDEQVNFQNSIRTYNAMKARGAEHVELWRAGKKFRHVSCALFAMVYTKMYFDGFMKNRPGSHGPHFKRFVLNLGKMGVKP